MALRAKANVCVYSSDSKKGQQQQIQERLFHTIRTSSTEKFRISACWPINMELFWDDLVILMDMEEANACFGINISLRNTGQKFGKWTNMTNMGTILGFVWQI